MIQYRREPPRSPRNRKDLRSLLSVCSVVNSPPDPDTKGMKPMTSKLAIQGAVLVAVLAGAVTVRSFQERSTASHAVTREQYEQWKKDLSNWGRWGKDDEIGTLNLITPAKR